MFNVLGSVPKSLANPFKSLALDDSYSRFNRIYLFAFAIISGVVVTINDLAGEKIECHGFGIFEHDFHENYCWTQVRQSGQNYTEETWFTVHLDLLFPIISPCTSIYRAPRSIR